MGSGLSISQPQVYEFIDEADIGALKLSVPKGRRGYRLCCRTPRAISSGRRECRAFNPFDRAKPYSGLAVAPPCRSMLKTLLPRRLLVPAKRDNINFGVYVLVSQFLWVNPTARYECPTPFTLILNKLKSINLYILTTRESRATKPHCPEGGSH